MSRRIPHWFPRASEDQKRRWLLWKATERRAIKEQAGVALEVMGFGKPETTLSAPLNSVESTLTGE